MRAKEFLSQKGISYVEKDVASDTAAAKDLMSKGFRFVPVIYVGDEVVAGFDRAKLEKLLA
ncbi:MAG: glutaredoxin family protein [Bacillota bacterium]